MAVLDQVPVDRITAEARQIQLGRAILTAIAAVLYLIGWVPSRVTQAVWMALAWSGTAVKVGWVDARRPTGGR